MIWQIRLWPFCMNLARGFLEEPNNGIREQALEERNSTRLQARVVTLQEKIQDHDSLASAAASVAAAVSAPDISTEGPLLSD